MLRLPTFTYHTPKNAVDAVRIAKEHGKEAMYVAGGTDLYPNMKRRHQTPAQVISLRDVPELHSMEVLADGRLQIGAMVTLTTLEHYPHLKAHYAGFAHAVREISTPLLRNMGTIGGNLLLDTRCSYYDQSHEWRESIDFCMKSKSSYLKLRRRDTYDFPVLGVGACLWFAEDGTIEKANIRLGGAGSYAMPASASEKLLVGNKLTDELIAAAGAAAMKPARTMDNTDLDVYWRKKVAPVYVARALKACQ